MNLLTGILYKIDAAHFTAMAAIVFSLCGFVLVCSLYYLARASSLSRAATLGMAAAFSILPQTLYLENLYIYSVPSTALLCLAGASFHGALAKGTAGRWFSFFAVCVVLCVVRSTFHLLWLALMVALALVAAKPGSRRRVVMASAAPVALLLALYVKNWALFDVFGTSSGMGANVAQATTRQLPEEERDALVRSGALSPFARISVFSGPDAYVDYFRGREKPPFADYPGSEQLERPTVHAANFNHWFYLVVNRRRQEDARYYLKAYPGAYWNTVLFKNLPQFFSSTTHWHPSDPKEGSAHYRHRQVLGAYEAFYDRLVHGHPAPVGIYALLPLVLLASLLGLWRSRDWRSPAAMIIVFSIFQIVYVVVVSVLFTYNELARYRFMVEPFIWLLVAMNVSSLARWAQRRWWRQPPTTDALNSG
jgi:hypothetical protein